MKRCLFSAGKVFFILVVLPWGLSVSFAQITFERTYGGPNDEFGISVRQTSDGGYIVVGSTHSMATYNDVYLVKTNSFGDTLWTKTFSGPSDDFGVSVEQTSDGGYIVGGIYSFDGGARDICLIKTNGSGDTLWTRTYGGPGLKVAQSVHQTPDGGYFIAGTAAFAWGDSHNVVLIKTNSSGDPIWTKVPAGTRNCLCEDAKRTTDGGYIVVGGAITSIYDSTATMDVHLIKTDSSGDTLWTRRYAGPLWEYGHTVEQTLDGGYIIAAQATSDGLYTTATYLIKTNALGDTVWTRNYGGQDWDYGRFSAQQTTDSGYVVAGSNTGEVHLIKTNSSGDTLWTRTRRFGGLGNGRTNSVRQTSDGGYIIAGSAHGSGSFDVCLIKTDANGLVSPLSWRPIATGVNYAVADSIADEGVFIGMGGYTATPDLINGWLAALYDAKLRELGIRHVYSVTGTDNLNNPRTNIAVLDLARHLLALMQKHPKGTRIILAGHSAGSLTAQALLHDLYDGASIDSSHLTDGAITYFCLDGNAGQSYYGTHVTQAIVNRLSHLYAVYAYDPTTGIYSLNKANMTNLGGAFGTSSSPLMLDVSGCGCQNNWCVHATLINSIPHTKTSGDPADFGADAGHPIQTAYLNVLPTSVPNTPNHSIHPTEFRLYQNYPNPFNPSTTIRYGLPQRSQVTLTVFNTLGQHVATLVQGDKEAGYHEVRFDGSGLSSGVYFYRLQAGDYVATKKLLLMK